MKKKTIGIIAVSVLCAFAIFAGAMFTHQYIDAKNSVEQFDELTNLIADVETEAWAPMTSYNRLTGRMESRYTKEIEAFEGFGRWIKAFYDGKPLVVPDAIFFIAIPMMIAHARMPM